MKKKKKRIIDISLIITILFLLILTFFNVKSLINSKKNDLENINGEGSLIDESEINSLEDSKIDGSNYINDSTYYVYYDMLDDNQKKLYGQIYENIINYKTTFIPIIYLNDEQTSQAIVAVYNDHPELFWLNNTYYYRYTKDGDVVQITLKFNALVKNIDENKKKFEDAANKIITEAEKLETIYEKEKYVHDTIASIVTYNTESLYNQTAYSALVLNKSVCAGYSRAFQYIMIKLKIPTYYADGYTAEGGHAWNIVKLSDGYYNLDLTWDDDNDILNYDNFNLSDSIFNITHERAGLAVNLPKCIATTYQKIEKKNNNNSNKKSNSTSNNDETSKSTTTINKNKETTTTTPTKTNDENNTNTISSTNNTTNNDNIDNTSNKVETTNKDNNNDIVIDTNENNSNNDVVIDNDENNSSDNVADDNDQNTIIDEDGNIITEYDYVENDDVNNCNKKKEI